MIEALAAAMWCFAMGAGAGACWARRGAERAAPLPPCPPVAPKADRPERDEVGELTRAQLRRVREQEKFCGAECRIIVQREYDVDGRRLFVAAGNREFTP